MKGDTEYQEKLLLWLAMTPHHCEITTMSVVLQFIVKKNHESITTITVVLDYLTEY